MVCNYCVIYLLRFERLNQTVRMIVLIFIFGLLPRMSLKARFLSFVLRFFLLSTNYYSYVFKQFEYLYSKHRFTRASDQQITSSQLHPNTTE